MRHSTAEYCEQAEARIQALEEECLELARRLGRAEAVVQAAREHHSGWVNCRCIVCRALLEVSFGHEKEAPALMRNDLPVPTDPAWSTAFGILEAMPKTDAAAQAEWLLKMIAAAIADARLDGRRKDA